MNKPIQLPVERHQPSPGIFIDRTRKSTTISGSMEISGDGVTPADAMLAQTTVNTAWTKDFPRDAPVDTTTEYSVRCDIKIFHKPPGAPLSATTQIEVRTMNGPSFVGQKLNRRFMRLNASETDIYTWTVAHEFGHIIGLDDRYFETLRSRIAGMRGGARTTSVESGYAGNMMAESGGTLAAQNLIDLNRENAPRRMQADNRIRAWLREHTNHDLAMLPNETKIEMVKVLIRGFVTDQDADAIVRIIGSVFMRRDMDEMRVAIDPNEVLRPGPRRKILNALTVSL